MGERVAFDGPRTPSRATVAISARPSEASPAPLLVIQVGSVGRGERAIISRRAEPLAVDEAHAQGSAKLAVCGQTWVESDAGGLDGESVCHPGAFDFGHDRVKVVLEVQ